MRTLFQEIWKNKKLLKHYNRQFHNTISRIDVVEFLLEASDFLTDRIHDFHLSCMFINQISYNLIHEVSNYKMQ